MTGIPKTAITIETPRSAPSTDADADADAKAKSNNGGGAEEKKEGKEEEKEEKKEGGGLYDLETRKKIQTFLEVNHCRCTEYMLDSRVRIAHERKPASKLQLARAKFSVFRMVEVER